MVKFTGQAGELYDIRHGHALRRLALEMGCSVLAARPRQLRLLDAGALGQQRGLIQAALHDQVGSGI